MNSQEGIGLQFLHKLQRHHCYVTYREGLRTRHPWESWDLSFNSTDLASVWLLERALPSYGSSCHLGNYSGIKRDQSSIVSRFLEHIESFRQNLPPRYKSPYMEGCRPTVLFVNIKHLLVRQSERGFSCSTRRSARRYPLIRSLQVYIN